MVDSCLNKFYNNPFKPFIFYFVMNKENKLKMAVIAGATAAVKYASNHKLASSEEIIKSVTLDMDKILNNIDTD